MGASSDTDSAWDPAGPIRAALATANRVAASAKTVVTEADLNQFTWTGRVPLAQLDVKDLELLIRDKHLVDIRVDATPWTLHLRRGGNDGDVTEDSGSRNAAVAQARLDHLEEALTAADLPALLQLLDEHEADFILKVINDPTETNVHWAASSSVITKTVDSDLWIPFARRIADGPAVLLLDDFNERTLRGDSLTVIGPRAVRSIQDLDPRPELSLGDLDSPFRIPRSPGGASLPSPLRFADLATNADAADPVVAEVGIAMRKLTALLIWLLVADSGEPAAGAVAIHISGARQLDVVVEPLGSEGIEHLVEMYQWAATSPEIDRLYFVQQALTLAIVSPSDANSAPEPALRTARSLYDLSRRSSVSEVMAARRSARETALSASRSAASQARDAASKAVERTIVQILAAAAVVVAQLQDAVSVNQSAALLALLAVVCALTGFATVFVVLRSARLGLDHELGDLDQYRDALSEDDITAVKHSGAVCAARSDVRRARTTAWVAHGVATVALSFAAVTTADFIQHTDSEPSPSPAQTRTNVDD